MQTYKVSTSPRFFEARLMGRIDGCTNPESAELLPDGEHFVFGNCTMMVGHPGYRAGQGIVYLKDQAFISQGKITPDGAVCLTERHLITSLTATLGIDLLRGTAGRFPAGTALIAEGGRPITVSGEPRIYQNAAPRLLIFDPLKGAVLAEVPLGSDSLVARKFNGVDQPNGLAITNTAIYFGDIPNSNPDNALPSPVPSAVYRIPISDLDAAAANVGPADIQRVEMPFWVNGLCGKPEEDVVYAVSCSLHDETGGSIYCLTPSDFSAGILPMPLISGIGLFIDGVACSRRGTLFASTPINGQVHAFTPDGEHHVIQCNGANPVRMPADFNICYPAALRGEPALLITDISVGFPPGDGSVVVADITGL